MINSMTGFGRAKSKVKDLELDVEVSSVNHRFLNIKVDLPEELAHYQNEARELAKGNVKRGSLSIKVNLYKKRGVESVLPNAQTVKTVYRNLKKIKTDVGVHGDITLSTILELPYIWNSNNGCKASDKSEKYWQIAKTLIMKAFSGLLKMRQREGDAIKDECLNRLENIRGFVRCAGKRAPQVIENYKKRLSTRINSLIAEKGLGSSEADITKEIGIFAERSDINEELGRLESHLNQARDLLNSQGEVGRRLDFITQEIVREANTLASKGADYEISHCAVNIKVEIEKIKELVENLE